MNDYSVISSLFEIEERRKMTVGELREALQKYPDDRAIHISIGQESRTRD